MKVLYYTAYHAQRKRVDYAIGPSQLDNSASRVEMYDIAATYFFGVTDMASIHEINSYRLLQFVRRGDYKSVVQQFGRSWLDVFQDPFWWMHEAESMGIAGGIKSASVAAKEAGTAAEQEARVLARAAGEQAATTGTGGVAIGLQGMPNDLAARIDATGVG
jgi:hypothetical protein